MQITKKNMIESQLRPEGISCLNTISCISKINREDFTPTEFASLSYAEYDIPLNNDYSMLKPLIVAKILQLSRLTKSDVVLEVGTGSGYQAAILSKLARRVYTLDRHRRLVREAREIFDTLDLNNITALTSDGSFGLLEQAPFDRIIVTAAAEDPPGPLLAQLKMGGIMVVPVGQSDTVQSLIKVQKTEDGLEYSELRPVRFVPLLEGLGKDG